MKFKNVLLVFIILGLYSCSTKLTQRQRSLQKGWILEFNLQNNEVLPIEPLSGELIIRNETKPFDINSPINYTFQIRKSTETEWNTLDLLLPEGNWTKEAVTNVEPNLKNNYRTCFALNPYKFTASFQIDKSDLIFESFWNYFSKGKYELRVTANINEQIDLSKTYTFKVIEAKGENLEFINYLRDAKKPQFLFDISQFGLDTRFFNIAKELHQRFPTSSMNKWVKFYLTELLFIHEYLAKDNVALRSEVSQSLNRSIPFNDCYFDERLKYIQLVHNLSD